MIEVLLFVKAPRAGFVKTRLATSIGPARAAEVYRQLGRRVLDQIEHVSRVTVWYTPADALCQVQAWLGGRRDYWAQPEGDLGARLSCGFSRHFEVHADVPAVAIGADAPGVDDAILDEASRQLERHEVVLGPATDGGYYLIGLQRWRPELFQGIPWGTERVFDTTFRVCQSLGITPAVLPPLRDVDTIEDAKALGFVSS